MAQITTVLQGDPATIKTQLVALAVSNRIQIIQKTVSAGKYIVVYDNTSGAGQFVDVFVGDPNTLAARINTLISGGRTIDVTSPTFSSANYLVVSR